MDSFFTGREVGVARTTSPLERRAGQNAVADETFPRPHTSDRSTLVAAAKEALISRRARHAFLDVSLFGEPGWDMLMALYVTEETEARNSITRLSDYSGAPPSTALRWIEHLGRSGLTRRVPHPTDARTAFVELTDEGRYALDEYFTQRAAMKATITRCCTGQT